MGVRVTLADRSKPLITSVRRAVVVGHAAEPRTRDDTPIQAPVHLIASEADDVSLYGADAPWIQG